MWDLSVKVFEMSDVAKLRAVKAHDVDRLVVRFESSSKNFEQVGEWLCKSAFSHHSVTNMRQTHAIAGARGLCLIGNLYAMWTPEKKVSVAKVNLADFGHMTHYRFRRPDQFCQFKCMGGSPTAVCAWSTNLAGNTRRNIARPPRSWLFSLLQETWQSGSTTCRTLCWSSWTRTRTS